MIRRVVVVVATCLATEPTLIAQPVASVCDAYGAADAVFIGEAGPRVRRPITNPDGSVVWGTFSPVKVERVFRGASTAVVFITPAGIETYLTPGEQYLVYGRNYQPPDQFMSGDMYGTKPLRDAAADLAFLNVAAVDGSGATISGVVELDESDVARLGTVVSPLPNVAIQLSDGDRNVTVFTDGRGEFIAAGLPSGTYAASAQLSADLILPADPTYRTRVLAGGCASMHLRVVPNGHVSGRVMTPDGRPAIGERIALIVAEQKPGEPDRYGHSASVDVDGRYTFDAVRPGKYLLGRLWAHTNTGLIPTIYYPGTLDRREAIAIDVARSGSVDVGEFRLQTR